MAAVAQQVVDQGQALGDVRVVVADRVGHRLGDDDPGSAADGGLDVGVVSEDPVDQVAVGDVAPVEGAVGDELGSPGGQVVQDDGLDAFVQAGAGDGGADESGTTGDEDLGHVFSQVTFRFLELETGAQPSSD